MTNRPLQVFSDPRSVAVVGASADPSKWGYWLARGALRGRERRRVDLVNARGALIEGVNSAPSLSELDEVPELVVLCAPPTGIPKVIDEALELGVRGFVGITAGIDNAHGEPGLERRLAEQIREAGARIIGPNCLGIYDAEHRLDLVWGHLDPGELAIISQSGQLGLEMAGLAGRAGLGVSRFVSVGNQVDVTACELLEDLCEDAQTTAVVLYLEDFTDGRRLVETMGRLAEANKPVIVLTVGASEASVQAARSHTGAMTAATDVVEAACRVAGAVLVRTPAEAIDLALLLRGAPRPAGRRVAVISDSGGQGGIAADALAREGLEVPALSDELTDQLAALLPREAGIRNPIDLAGAGEQDLDTYHLVTHLLLASDEVDTVVLSGYFGSYGSDTPTLTERELEVVDALAGAVGEHQRPVLVHSMAEDSTAVRAMRAAAVPTMHTIERIARALRYAVKLTAPRRPAGQTAGTAAVSRGRSLDYLDARDVLASQGVVYPPAAAVTTAEQVRTVAAELPGPYVLKAGWLEHKTEVGGVAVALADAQAAAAAFEEMRTRLGPGDYVLESMDDRRDTVELVVGLSHDDSFGATVLVGAGGVQAELHRDVQIALAPVDEAEAVQMIRSLRSYPLLAGWRSRPPVDVDGAAKVVAAVSRLASANGVAECEINPLRVGPDGAVAVDAIVIEAGPMSGGDR